MTTDSHLADEAIDQGAALYPPASEITYVPMPYETVKVWLTNDPQFDNAQIDYALERFWHGYLKNAAIAAKHAPQQAPAQRPQTPQHAPQNAPQRPAQSQGGGGQRGSQYPPQGLVSTLNDPEQWTCDKCHGTGEGVARRPQKGRMPGDAIVCLNPACKEGDFRYTITFVEDGMGPVDNGQPDLDPAALPF